YAPASGGAGYAHPDELPNRPAYLTLSKPLDDNLGLSTVFIVPGTKRIWEPTIYQTYVQTMQPKSVFLKHPQGSPPALVSGVPVMSVTYLSKKTKTFNHTDIVRTVSDLQNLATMNKFIFVFMTARNPSLSFIQALSRALGPNFVLLRADEFGKV